MLAAGADLTGRPGLRRVSRLSAVAGLVASMYFLVADLGPPGAVSSHAAGGEAELADECRYVDPFCVRARRGAGGGRGADAKLAAA